MRIGISAAKRLTAVVIAAFSLDFVRLLSQTTQGLISGRVIYQASGKPLAGVVVTYQNLATGTNGQRTTEASGNYSLPLLSPGLVPLASAAPSGFQPREYQEISLPVAGSGCEFRAAAVGRRLRRPARRNIQHSETFRMHHVCLCDSES
jgi:hypothetical protein